MAGNKEGRGKKVSDEGEDVACDDEDDENRWRESEVEKRHRRLCAFCVLS